MREFIPVLVDIDTVLSDTEEQVVQDAVEGWERMRQLGYSPRICAESADDGAQDAQLKDRIAEHFAPAIGMYVIDDLIVTAKKHELDALALIDAHPFIYNEVVAPWQHIIFHSPANEQVQDKPRLYGWLDRNLGRLLTNAAHYRPYRFE